MRAKGSRFELFRQLAVLHTGFAAGDVPVRMSENCLLPRDAPVAVCGGAVLAEMNALSWENLQQNLQRF
jgi:hypothetical protein